MYHEFSNESRLLTNMMLQGFQRSRFFFLVYHKFYGRYNNLSNVFHTHPYAVLWTLRNYPVCLIII
jgi:hypothetical protein